MVEVWSKLAHIPKFVLTLLITILVEVVMLFLFLSASDVLKLPLSVLPVLLFGVFFLGILVAVLCAWKQNRRKTHPLRKR